MTLTSEEDLAEDLKKNVLAYFRAHCKDDGIISDLDDFHVAAPGEQCSKVERT